MTKQRNIDPDAPPTSFEDWRTAHVRRPRPSRPPKPPIPDGQTFHLFQASNDRRLFVVTDGRNPSELVDCPKGGFWVPLKVFRETGDRRVAFSEAEAKEDIRQQGFYLIDLEKRHRTSHRAAARKTGLAEDGSQFKVKTVAPRPSTRRARR